MILYYHGSRRKGAHPEPSPKHVQEELSNHVTLQMENEHPNEKNVTVPSGSSDRSGRKMQYTWQPPVRKPASSFILFSMQGLYGVHVVKWGLKMSEKDVNYGLLSPGPVL